MKNIDVTVMEEYEWNPDSFIMKHIHYEGCICSYVVERERQVIVLKKPKEVIDHSCMYYGTSLEGNQKGTVFVTNFKKKVPITICESLGLLVFPTISPAKDFCCWISYPHIQHIKKKTPNEAIVNFSNNISEIVPISASSLSLQVSRAALLHSRLKNRIAETRRYYSLVDEEHE